MIFQIQAQKDCAITKIVAHLQRNITVSMLKARFMHTRIKVIHVLSRS